MRLKKYINESKDIDVNSVINNCRPFLKELSKNKFKNFMYSGRKGKTEPHFIGKVRTDRKPKDTPIGIHTFIDKLFKKRFGWKTRSNAIFCTGDIWSVEKYGTPYMIFPIGKFKFVWSPRVKDLYEFASTSDEIMDIIDTYTNKNLNKALESYNEIMVNCKEYYAFNDFYTFDKHGGLIDEIKTVYK